MRVALVASSFLPQPGRLERHVDQLARGLAQRGAEVQILTQGSVHGPQVVEECQGVSVLRYPTALGPVRFAVAPKLWEPLRRTAEAVDLVDVHTRRPSLGLAVSRVGVSRLVLTPGASIHHFVSWPYARATRTAVGAATRIVCRTQFERDLLCRTFPQAAGRTLVVPEGLDTSAIQAATPFASFGTVVLAVGRLERAKGVQRAIAAMAGLDPQFRLVVVGDGPARRRLQAFAVDLRISRRVHFTGAVPDDVLYRWLRTSRVVVTLARQHGSGSQITEALAAGASVVASAIPAHRQVAEEVDDGRVILVTPEGSPLEVADAIADAAARADVGADAQALPSLAPSWESVVDSRWRLYEQLIGGATVSARADDRRGTIGVTPEICGGVETGSELAIRAEPQAGGEPAVRG